MLARVVVMYAVVAVVNLATRFERMRWQRALERERVMQNEQVELSQAIHDTAAQSAYIIGMGVNVAKTLADDSNVELTTTLDATSRLCRSLILELRHPINVGGIYEGRELSRSLRLHAASFTNVTLVPLNMTHTGVEVKSTLFSVANNALTNMPQNRPPPSICRVPTPATAGLWLSGRARIPPASSLLHCNSDCRAVDQLPSISRTDTPVRRATRVRLQGDDDLGC